MVAIVKTPAPGVAAAGGVCATPPAFPPVAMAQMVTAWTTSTRTFIPTNGPRYNAFEMAIIAESDQTLWNGIAEQYLADLRGARDGLSATDMAAERTKLRAWHAAYKTWAGL